MSSYWELLKDPRWQRMRLEVMERADFACEECGATDKTLNIHHTYYSKGRKPWEYPSEALRCLCQDCHGWTEDALAEIRELIGRLSLDDLSPLRGVLRAVLALKATDDIDVRVESWDDVFGLTAIYGIRDHDVKRGRDYPFTITTSELEEISQRRYRQMKELDDAEFVRELEAESKRKRNEGP